MHWLTIDDYKSSGWAGGDPLSRARHYCDELERGQLLFFTAPPFALPQEDIKFLVSLKPADSRLHKNISYRPEEDMLRGFGDDAHETQVHDVMRRYAGAVKSFVSTFLAPYAGKFQMDYASFRPLEEQGRDLSLHKRNDLLHVDAFPSRPTRGGRILRVFTNVNPDQSRIWVIAERFPELARRFAKDAGLDQFANATDMFRSWKRQLRDLGLPVVDRAPYDKFMLHFHDWLKEHGTFQESKEGKEQIEFPPMSTWLVYTDGVPHSALSGQFAMEQTFIVPVEALVTPEAAPIRVLEKMSGRVMS